MKRECPHCGEQIEFKITVKGVKKKEKKAPSYPKSVYDEIIEHYLEVKGTTDQTAINLQYGRLMKAVKGYLDATDGDKDLIIAKIHNAKDYFESKDLDWKIETIGKHWQEIDDKGEDTYVGW